MQKLKRIFMVTAGCSAALSAGILVASAAVQKALHMKCCRVNYAGQKPGVCIIGGSKDGPTAVFVSTKYRPGWSRQLALALGAIAAVSAGIAVLFDFLLKKQGGSR